MLTVKDENVDEIVETLRKFGTAEIEK